MHEVHLISALLEEVERQARIKKSARVRSIHLRYNPLTSHSGGHMRFSFDILKKDRPLFEHATLELTEVPPLLRCRRCGNEFQGRQLPEICPRCSQTDVAPLHSTDLVLQGFELEP
jgi:hydrogenase nickel incorporation protein HypA/HybF